MATAESHLKRHALSPVRALFMVASISVAVAGLLGLAASPAGAATNTGAPQLQVTASGSTIVGLQVFANVNVAGGNAPTGTLTFSLFGVNDPGCNQAPLFTSTVVVSGVSVNSEHYTTAAAGTYRWEASYSGDANNPPVAPTPCANPSAAVIVSQAMTGLGVTAAAPVGSAIWATARIGGFSPTGTITFYLTPPGDMFCSTPPVFTSTVAVNGAGTYASARYQLPDGGLYKWRAIYSGDNNNMGGAITSCLDPNAGVTVPAFAGFAYPQQGWSNVDPQTPFSWTPASGATAYLLIVGTTPGAWDLVWSGVLPTTQTSFTVGALPGGPLYAAVYTQINGVWNSHQAISFTAGANEAGLTAPTSGQANVSTTAPVSWTTVSGVLGYAMWIGTTYGGSDILSTALLPPTQSSLAPPPLPVGQTVYALMFTLHTDMTWTYQAVTFTTAGAPHNLSSAESAQPAAPPCLGGSTVPACAGTFSG